MTLKQLKGIIPDGTVLKLMNANYKKEVIGELKVNAAAVGLKNEYADWSVTCFRPDTLEVFIYNKKDLQ